MEPHTIAVIGAGVAGRAFALRCAIAGFDVVLEDVMPANLRRAQDEYADLTSVSSGGSLRCAASIADAVRTAEIVVDFVPDELESKLEMFSLADRMAPPHSIFCSPLTNVSITDLASCTYRASLCVGLRGFPGATAEVPVQVVRSRFCSDATVASVSQMLVAIGVAFDVVDEIVSGSYR